MNKSLAPFFLIVILIFISPVYAENSVIDILEEGERKGYNLNGKDYDLLILHITSDESAVTFIVNGEKTGEVGLGNTTTLIDNSKITVMEIFLAEGDVAKFKLISSCGNGICDNNEICELDSCCRGSKIDFLSDKLNCGKCGLKCNNVEICSNGSCIPKIVCGNNICDSEESCEKDNCCNGREVNILSNEKHCGKCDFRCEKTDNCENGKCIGFCGNGICEPQEGFESCKEDCKNLINNSSQNITNKDKKLTETPKEKKSEEILNLSQRSEEIIEENKTTEVTTSTKEQSDNILLRFFSWFFRLFR